MPIFLICTNREIMDLKFHLRSKTNANFFVFQVMVHGISIVATVLVWLDTKLTQLPNLAMLVQLEGSNTPQEMAPA